MIEIALMCLLNAFAIVGFHLSTQEGMILDFIPKLLTAEKLSKPLYDCPTCMASLHSTYFFIPFAIVHDPTLLYIYPLYILALAGVSTLVYRVIDCLESKLQ